MEREWTARHRCLCCDGIIDGIVDDGVVGFDARIGFFSDECAFVCNDCTTSQIETTKLRRQHAARRK